MIQTLNKNHLHQAEMFQNWMLALSWITKYKKRYLSNFYWLLLLWSYGVDALWIIDIWLTYMRNRETICMLHKSLVNSLVLGLWLWAVGAPLHQLFLCCLPRICSFFFSCFLLLTLSYFGSVHYLITSNAHANWTETWWSTYWNRFFENFWI